MAAAVLLRAGAARLEVNGLDDSKKLSAAARRRVFDELRTHAPVAIGLSIVPAEAIDDAGILHARLHALARAARALPITPGMLFVDGDRILEDTCATRQTAIIGGDAIVSVVAAASVLAKVVRDELMTEAGRRFPEYGFESHMGYGTQRHRDALREVGPCGIHRRSYGPVREAAELHGMPLP